MLNQSTVQGTCTLFKYFYFILLNFSSPILAANIVLFTFLLHYVCLTAFVTSYFSALPRWNHVCAVVLMLNVCDELKDEVFSLFLLQLNKSYKKPLLDELENASSQSWKQAVFLFTEMCFSQDNHVPNIWWCKDHDALLQMKLANSI